MMEVTVGAVARAAAFEKSRQQGFTQAVTGQIVRLMLEGEKPNGESDEP